MKGKKHSAEQIIKKLREAEAMIATGKTIGQVVQTPPIVEHLHARWLAVRDELRPSTKLAEAVNYALHRWPTLVRYLDDGELPIDTNYVEREICPLAIGRANWLYLGHVRAGTTASALL